MFDRPSDGELFDRTAERRREWFNQASDREVAIHGAGLDALVAGIFLQEDDIDTFIVTEADYPGGRLTWDNGPVPIFYPANNQLEDLGYPLDGLPPYWIDRNALLSFLVQRYFSRSGVLLTGVRTEGVPRAESDELEWDLILDQQTRSVTVQNFISTKPNSQNEPTDDTIDDPLDYLVRHTDRQSQGVVVCGRAVFSPSERDSSIPLESAYCLSGRKASELVREDRD
jgi:ribulose 1,5-bisphosphate synthetase/thiazole synthase